MSWDFQEKIHNGWVGGKFLAPNLSGGFHGIMKQYWEYFINKYHNNNQHINVLLVSESNKVKKNFLDEYPNWNVDTIDLYYDLYNEIEKPTIVGDICSLKNPLTGREYDLIICQATLEHVYNPFGAMNNLLQVLRKNGILVTHTHPPAAEYHRYPSDYFRFMKDWWYDLEKYIQNIELLELYMNQNLNVFTCYKRV